MLRICYGGDVYPLHLNAGEWHITHAYNGKDTLSFEIDTGHELYRYMVEETPIEVDDYERYLIKSIDERTDFADVTCDIDLDAWKGYVLTDARWTNATLSQIMEQIKPDGWTVSGAGVIARHTTVEQSEGQPWPVVTPLEILDTLSEVYEVVFNFSPCKKIIYVIQPETYPVSDDFLSDEVNLTSIGFVGNSESFATRLYAYGKQDEETGERVTFASINGGREYVENHSYSDKVICVGWSDERYTVPENLLTDAQKRLDEMAWPVRSYNLTAENLDATLFLYKKVNLIDRRRKISVVHQVVEFTEYPDDHTRDNVNLSAVTPQIQTLLDKQASDFKSELDYHDMTMQKVITDSIQHATDMITGNEGGYFQWVFDDDGHPVELLNLGDSMDVNSARNVWRWNASGLGHSSNGYNGPYTLALLADGSINADVITTGTLNAGVVRAGILSDAAGNMQWNLETGDLVANRFTINAPNLGLTQDGHLTTYYMHAQDAEFIRALLHDTTVFMGDRFTDSAGNADCAISVGGAGISMHQGSFTDAWSVINDLNNRKLSIGLYSDGNYYFDVSTSLLVHNLSKPHPYEYGTTITGYVYAMDFHDNSLYMRFVNGMLVEAWSSDNSAVQIY